MQNCIVLQSPTLCLSVHICVCDSGGGVEIALRFGQNSRDNVNKINNLVLVFLYESCMLSGISTLLFTLNQQICTCSCMSLCMCECECVCSAVR